MRGDDLAAVVIEQHPHLSTWKLQKLLFYIDSWHLAITGERLVTDQPFRAYANGPVHEGVMHARREPQSRARQGHGPSLPDDAQAIVDLVMVEFGGRTGDELSALTHTEEPWLAARGDLPEGEPSREPIKVEVTAHFFRENRRLGNRTAVDLAAGGIHTESTAAMSRALDLDSLIADLPPLPEEDDTPPVRANLADTTMLR